MKATVKKRVFLMGLGYGKVEGEISIPQGMRISDFLNKKDRDDFASVSGAKIYYAGGSSEEADFLAVNKNHIVYLKEPRS